jgi:hypothetical protein
MTNNENFPDHWCQMWNTDPALAHELVSEQGRQWANRTPGLDTVVGPGPTQAFVTEWAAKTGNRFRARVLAIGDELAGGALVGYTWDVTKGDGSIVTGADFNVLEHGLVVDNWTFVGDVRDQRDDPELTFADPYELRQLVSQDAQDRHVRVHREPALDPKRGTAAYLWQPAEDRPGGIDLIAVSGGRISWRWSLTATRPFRY